MKKVKTVNAYIDDNMESLDGKIITVYNDDKNIVYHGKTEYAPLSLYMELKSVETRKVDTVDGDTVEEVIINVTVECKEEEKMKKELIRKQVEVTRKQVEEISKINAATRYKAMDKVAEILGFKTGYRAGWAKSQKTIIIDKDTFCEICYSKGKVKSFSYYSRLENVVYDGINVKKYLKNNDEIEESVKKMSAKLGKMLLPQI